MDGIEGRVRGLVREYIAKITFDCITTYREWARARDEFRLTVHIND